MNIALIFLWVWAAMAATSLWEASVEGRNAWAKGKLGWRIRLGSITLTAYHFWLFWAMFPLLLTLPLIINGWDARLFGVLLSAYASGLVLEDFLWFVFNPVVKLSEFGPRFADYYPWLRIGNLKVPVLYISGVFIAVASWYWLWRF